MRKDDNLGYAPDHYGHAPFGGIVLLENYNLEFHPKSTDLKEFAKFPSEDRFVGYLIGDYTSPQEYEVVTAYVDPRYKGMDWAVKVHLN